MRKWILEKVYYGKGDWYVHASGPDLKDGEQVIVLEIPKEVMPITDAELYRDFFYNVGNRFEHMPEFLQQFYRDFEKRLTK